MQVRAERRGLAWLAGLMRKYQGQWRAGLPGGSVLFPPRWPSNPEPAGLGWSPEALAEVPDGAARCLRPLPEAETWFGGQFPALLEPPWFPGLRRYFLWLLEAEALWRRVLPGRAAG